MTRIKCELHQAKRLVPRKHLNSTTTIHIVQHSFYVFYSLYYCSILISRTTKQGKTMNFINVLDAATTQLSDYGLAKKLKISTTTVSAWRNRGTIPTDETLEKLAEMAGISVEKVLYAAYADKVHNPVVAKLLREQSHLAA